MTTTADTRQRGWELATAGELAYPVIAYTDSPSGPSKLQSAAIAVAVKTIEDNGRWVRFGRAHRPADGNPGDCLFVPPACLLDMDEASRQVARRWRLVVGVLTEPEGAPLFHAWLEYQGQVVSVSNLRNGFPAYVMEQNHYYAHNGLQSELAKISPRSLRLAARRTGGGNELAKWIRQRWASDTEGEAA